MGAVRGIGSGERAKELAPLRAQVRAFYEGSGPVGASRSPHGFGANEHFTPFLLRVSIQVIFTRQ
jgi:hypothetical protein